MALELARSYVDVVCKPAPENTWIEVIWHDHDLGRYPSLGVVSDHFTNDATDLYVSRAEAALEAFDDAVDWSRLKALYYPDSDDDDLSDED